MTENGGFPTDLFVNEGTVQKPDWRPVRVAVVRWLTKEGTYAAPREMYGERGFELYLYDGGIYRDGATAYIHSRIEDAHEHIGLTAQKSFIQEATAGVARRNLKALSTFNPPGFLNLENGVYEIATSELHPHSPARRFTWQLPIKFDPSVGCPAWLRFLAEVMPDERTRREIQKLFGYCIGVPGNPYQCATLFVGEGNNGKSTVLSVLTAVLGKENVAAETLTSLTEDYRFSTVNLWGKLANIFADLPTNPLRYTGTFKALTGGDLMRAEHKFGKTFYFTNPAKLVFSANELPQVDDRTLAFWRRWNLFKFEVNFTGREDRALLGKLLAELPGVLNWALAGIPLLTQDAGFITGIGADDLKSEWRRRSDTLAWFVEERVIADPTARAPKDEFYEAYADFCAANKATPRSPEIVGKLLPMHLPSVRSARAREGGDVVRFWLGMRLRSGAPGVQPPGTPSTPDTGGGRQEQLPDGGVSGVSSVSGSCTPGSPATEEAGNWTVPPKDRAPREGDP